MLRNIGGVSLHGSVGSLTPQVMAQVSPLIQYLAEDYPESPDFVTAVRGRRPACLLRAVTLTWCDVTCVTTCRHAGLTI